MSKSISSLETIRNGKRARHQLRQWNFCQTEPCLSPASQPGHWGELDVASWWSLLEAPSVGLVQLTVKGIVNTWLHAQPCQLVSWRVPWWLHFWQCLKPLESLCVLLCVEIWWLLKSNLTQKIYTPYTVASGTGEGCCWRVKRELGILGGRRWENRQQAMRGQGIFCGEGRRSHLPEGKTRMPLGLRKPCFSSRKWLKGIFNRWECQEMLGSGQWQAQL